MRRFLDQETREKVGEYLKDHTTEEASKFFKISKTTAHRCRAQLKASSSEEKPKRKYTKRAASTYSSPLVIPLAQMDSKLFIVCSSSMLSDVLREMRNG